MHEPNFTMVPSKLDLVIPALTREELGFAQSPEHASLHGTAEDLPGVVTCCYAQYVGRLLDDGAPATLMAKLMAPLNDFAAWKDISIDEMLASEAFAGVEISGMAAQLRPFMSDDLGRLYDCWKMKK